MMNLNVQRLDSAAMLPTRAYPGDAGLDLYAAHPVTIEPGHHKLTPTSLAVEIPEGHVGLVCPRSGLAASHAITVLNAPGIIDAGYRGEVRVNLMNHGTHPANITAGMRIAQLVIVPCVIVSPMEVGALSSAERGARGHGSSGVR